MNYEEAFRHYREGTATDEEKAFVLDELAKAKALSTLLDDEALAVKPAPIKQAEAEDVRSAKHHLVVKRALAALIAIAVIIVALGAILGGVFGSAASYAKGNMEYSKTDARELASEFAKNDVLKRGLTAKYTEADLEREIDEGFNFASNITSSYYSYEVDVKVYAEDESGVWWELEYEILVNSHTGSASLLEPVDIEREYGGPRR